MDKSFFKNHKLFFLGILIALLVCAADLYSKKQIFAFLERKSAEENLLYPQMKITNFFNLVKVWNRGVSFGMFNGLENGKYILSLMNALITFALLIWLYKNQTKYLTIAIALII